MRSGILVGTSAVLAVVWLCWPTAPSAPGADRIGDPARVRTTLLAPPPPPPPPPRADDDDAPRLPVRSLHDDCGLPATAHCAGSDCVLMLAGPDLDRFTGWMQLALQSPGLALATASRQVGMPDTTCATTLRGLDADLRILALEAPDGAELWCAAPQGLEALCDRAARGQPRPWHGSFLDSPRVLQFDR